MTFLNNYAFALIFGAVATPLIAGVFGIYIVKKQNEIHAEVRSTNGVPTGAAVTQTNERLQRVEEKQAFISEKVTSQGRRIANVETITLTLAASEATANRAAQKEREKLADDLARAHAPAAVPAVVVVSPVATEAH